MIHFDSHPDLLLPSDIKASDMSNIYGLYEKLSIENWILPACFLGVIDTIIWIKPPWSTQIKQGHFEFKIGRHKDSQKVLITCIENYFVAEGIICDPADLLDTKDINLYVVELSNEPVNPNILNHLREILVGKPAILDIDLDFFSTRNPFLNLYSEINLYQSLKQIYKFQSVPENLPPGEKLKLALESSQNRKELLDNLDDLTSHLAQGGSANNYEGDAGEYFHHFSMIQKAIQQNCGKNERIDWKMIHDAGCTCDDTDLPHHVSSNEEISILLRQTRTFLQNLSAQLTVITVARSSLDEFCPENQVEMIQSQLIDLLQTLVVGELDIKNGYRE